MLSKSSSRRLSEETPDETLSGGEDKPLKLSRKT